MATVGIIHTASAFLLKESWPACSLSVVNFDLAFHSPCSNRRIILALLACTCLHMLYMFPVVVCTSLVRPMRTITRIPGELANEAATCSHAFDWHTAVVASWLRGYLHDFVACISLRRFIHKRKRLKTHRIAHIAVEKR